MTMEFIGPKLSEDTEPRVYRIKAQTDIATMVGLTRKAVTFAEAEAEAQMFCSMPTKPYVIEEICSEEDWDLGSINFCPRCGHKLEAPIENSAGFPEVVKCGECYATSEVSIVQHSTFKDEPTDPNIGSDSTN
jgi:hypothetical protein